jgi:hypothetical protein
MSSVIASGRSSRNCDTTSIPFDASERECVRDGDVDRPPEQRGKRGGRVARADVRKLAECVELKL